MMKKKFLPVILSVALVLSMNTAFSVAEEVQSTVNTQLTPKDAVAVTTSGDMYTDVSEHWGRSIVNDAAKQGLVKGYPDGTFKPDNIMKREEFMTLISAVLTEKPDTSKTILTYTDVDPIEWYVPVVKTVVEAGISKGYDQYNFGIGIGISREEAAQVVYTIVPSDNLSATSVSSAKDNGQISPWAYNGVDIMFKKGYMKGDLEGNFRPKTALTRAEAATLLLNVKTNEKTILGPNQKKTEIPVTTTNSGVLQGKGTKADPYQIATEDDLNLIKGIKQVDASYILTKDIRITKDFTSGVLTNEQTKGLETIYNYGPGNFAPIGSKEVPFEGHFDGNGYEISGLKISGISARELPVDLNSKPAASYVGLFAATSEKALVEDLTITASEIKGNQYTGGICGYNKGEINNCTIAASTSVSGSSYTGGIVGGSTGNIIGNTNKGTTKGLFNYTGGIAGSVAIGDKALVEDCENMGTVIGNQGTGGIAGIVTKKEGDSSTYSLSACVNSGKVSSEAYHAGGIAGILESGTARVYIEDCVNKGQVSAKGVVGGIAGYVKGEKANLRTSTNKGDVSGIYSGGIAGENGGTIELCGNLGTINGEIQAGGIVAFQTKDEAEIKKCFNEGKIISESQAGGIAAENKAFIIDSYNAGTINGKSDVGGIVGRNNGNITQAYNAGKVSSNSNSGSMVGRLGGTIELSYWMEDTEQVAVGSKDSSGKTTAARITKLQLSGQETVKTSAGNETIIEALNGTRSEAVWQFTNKSGDNGVYDYPTLIGTER